MIDGVAHLSGTVNSYFEKTRAEEAASHVRGIVAIENHLHVLGGTSPLGPLGYDPYVDDERFSADDPWYGYAPSTTSKRDAIIARDIRDELWWSPFVEADEVQVSVE